MQLGDAVCILGCGCAERSHAYRRGIVTAIDHEAFALEVLLNEAHPFPEPPLNEACGQPLHLELL